MLEAVSHGRVLVTVNSSAPTEMGISRVRAIVDNFIDTPSVDKLLIILIHKLFKLGVCG
jgi:hypothetical protein